MNPDKPSARPERTSLANQTNRLLAAVLAGICAHATATASPLTALEAYLKAGNTGEYDSFGYSVAVSGDTAVVGAPFEDSSTTGVNSIPNENAWNAGAAYVFVRSGSNWIQQAYLKASNTGAGNQFGTSVAVSGDTLVIGASFEDGNSGAAYVFVRNGSTWGQQAYLKASNTEGGDWFGTSVAVSGDTVVVGAPRESGGSTGVNGPSNEDAAYSGAAYVFTRSGFVWTQQAYLKAGNTGAGDRFGDSVAISADTVVVGAPSEDASTTGVNNPSNEGSNSSGAAYVFVRSGQVWTQQAYLKASNPGASDYFGWSVAVSENTAVIGAPGEDSGTTGVNSTPNESASYSGAAYVFTRGGTTWTQQAFLKAGNTGESDEFGDSVAVSGDTVVVGALAEGSGSTGVNSTPDENLSGAGAAYIFKSNGSAWTQGAYLKASHHDEYDSFGCSVAVSGDTVVVGAFYEDSGTTGVNGIPNESASDSGAVFVYVPPFRTANWTGDADSGIDATRGTLWARRFGTATNATINGVTLTGTGYVVSSPEFDLAGPNTNYTLDDSNNLTGLGGQGSAEAAKRFVYGGNPATLTFKQLVPGYTYTASLFSVGWDTTPGVRAQTFSSGSDSRVLDPNAYGNNAGCRIDYTFTADAATRALTITPPNTTYTFHLYAVALRVEGGITPVTPVTIQIPGFSSELSAPYDRSPLHVRDDSGLTNGLHGTVPDGNMWLTKGTFQAPYDPLPAEITFDLGNTVDLSSIHVWNYNESGGFPSRGCKDVTISVASTAGGTFTPVGNFVFAQAPGAPNYAGERILFSRTGVRQVKFTITSNWGDTNQFAGLSEVKFYAASPAPLAPPDLKLTRNGANLGFNFTTLPGFAYTLWQSDTMAPGSWTNTGQSPVFGNGTAKSFTLPAPNNTIPKRFYRVQAQ